MITIDYKSLYEAAKKQRDRLLESEAQLLAAVAILEAKVNEKRDEKPAPPEK